MFLSNLVLAIGDSDLSINWLLWLSHTNNDCSNRDTWLASHLKLSSMKLVASEAASKLHSVRASCTTSYTTRD